MTNNKMLILSVLMLSIISVLCILFIPKDDVKKIYNEYSQNYCAVSYVYGDTLINTTDVVKGIKFSELTTPNIPYNIINSWNLGNSPIEDNYIINSDIVLTANCTYVLDGAYYYLTNTAEGVEYGKLVISNAKVQSVVDETNNTKVSVTATMSNNCINVTIDVSSHLTKLAIVPNYNSETNTTTWSVVYDIIAYVEDFQFFDYVETEADTFSIIRDGQLDESFDLSTVYAELGSNKYNPYITIVEDGVNINEPLSKLDKYVMFIRTKYTYDDNNNLIPYYQILCANLYVDVTSSRDFDVTIEWQNTTTGVVDDTTKLYYVVEVIK